MNVSQSQSELESIGTRYINRFAIDEEDQFEIAAVICRIYPINFMCSYEVLQSEINKAMEAVEKLSMCNIKGQDLYF